MASAAPAEPDAVASSPAPAKSGGKGGLVAMLIPVVLSVAASGGVSFFMAHRAAATAADSHAAAGEGHEGGEHGKDDKAAPVAANYVPLDPAFVVNLADADGSRFLQIDVQAMTRTATGVDPIKAQMPRIRNALLLLFGQQKSADLVTREGKEKLQADVLAELQKIMQEETGKPLVDAVYFTSFVMQ